MRIIRLCSALEGVFLLASPLYTGSALVLLVRCFSAWVYELRKPSEEWAFNSAPLDCIAELDFALVAIISPRWQPCVAVLLSVRVSLGGVLEGGRSEALTLRSDRVHLRGLGIRGKLATNPPRAT